MQSTLDLNANRMARVQLGESVNVPIKMAPPSNTFGAVPPPQNSYTLPAPQNQNRVNATTNSMTGSMNGSEPALCMHISSSSQLNFRLRDPPPSLTASTEKRLHQITEETTYNNNRQNQQMQPYTQQVTVNSGLVDGGSISSSTGNDTSSQNDNSDIKTTTNIRLGYDEPVYPEPVYATIDRSGSSAGIKPHAKMSISSAESDGSPVTDNDYTIIPSINTAPPPPLPPAPILGPTTTTLQKLTRFQMEKSKTPQQSPRSDSEADNESATWNSLEDSRSEMSYGTTNSNGSGSLSGSHHDSIEEEDSAFSMAGTEENNPVDELMHTRTAVMESGTSAVMTQISFDSENTAKSPKFRDLLVDICKASMNYFKRKEGKSMSLNPTQLQQLVLSDRKQVSEHLKSLNSELSENINLVSSAGRRALDKHYVGSMVTSPEHSKSGCVLGKQGVIVLLRENHRFSATQEFSKQLCDHITTMKPQSLGEFRARNAKEKLGLQRRNSVVPNQLMQQMFICDTSMTVGEAAKRSLVEVLDFVMF